MLQIYSNTDIFTIFQALIYNHHGRLYRQFRVLIATTMFYRHVTDFSSSEGPRWTLIQSQFSRFAPFSYELESQELDANSGIIARNRDTQVRVGSNRIEPAWTLYCNMCACYHSGGWRYTNHGGFTSTMGSWELRKTWMGVVGDAWLGYLGGNSGSCLIIYICYF